MRGEVQHQVNIVTGAKERVRGRGNVLLQLMTSPLIPATRVQMQIARNLVTSLQSETPHTLYWKRDMGTPWIMPCH